MAISARPTKSTEKPAAAPASDAQLLAFVDKGGTVAKKEAAAEPGRSSQHPLRFPNPDLFERLEKARKAGVVKLPRNTWILQAIAEKLTRDGH